MNSKLSIIQERVLIPQIPFVTIINSLHMRSIKMGWISRFMSFPSSQMHDLILHLPQRLVSWAISSSFFELDVSVGIFQTLGGFPMNISLPILNSSWPWKFTYHWLIKLNLCTLPRIISGPALLYIMLSSISKDFPIASSNVSMLASLMAYLTLEGISFL